MCTPDASQSKIACMQMLVVFELDIEIEIDEKDRERYNKIRMNEWMKTRNNVKSEDIMHLVGMPLCFFSLCFFGSVFSSTDEFFFFALFYTSFRHSFIHLFNEIYLCMRWMKHIVSESNSLLDSCFPSFFYFLFASLCVCVLFMCKEIVNYIVFSFLYFLSFHLQWFSLYYPIQFHIFCIECICCYVFGQTTF